MSKVKETEAAGIYHYRHQKSHTAFFMPIQNKQLFQINKSSRRQLSFNIITIFASVLGSH